MPSDVNKRPLASLTADQASALQSLGYLYLQHGQLGRGLALIVLADRCRPGVPTIMRSLAYAYLKNSEPKKALHVIASIEQIDRSLDMASPLQLMKAQALWLSGAKSQGRQVFANFNSARQAKRNRIEHFEPPATEQDFWEEPEELLLEQGDRT